MTKSHFGDYDLTIAVIPKSSSFPVFRYFSLALVNISQAYLWSMLNICCFKSSLKCTLYCVYCNKLLITQVLSIHSVDQEWIRIQNTGEREGEGEGEGGLGMDEMGRGYNMVPVGAEERGMRKENKKGRGRKQGT